MATLKMNALAFAVLIRCLDERPRTMHTLAEMTGLHLWTIRNYVKALHKLKQIHIVRWDKDGMGRDTTPYWSLGFGADVPRAAQPGAARALAYRERKREAVRMGEMVAG